MATVVCRNFGRKWNGSYVVPEGSLIEWYGDLYVVIGYDDTEKEYHAVSYDEYENGSDGPITIFTDSEMTHAVMW